MEVLLQQVVFQRELRVLPVNVLMGLRVVRHNVVSLLLPLEHFVLRLHYPIPVVRHAVLRIG